MDDQLPPEKQALRRAAEVLPCPHCNAGCADFEALQIHVFTACAAAEGVEAAAAAAPPPPRAAARK